MLETARLSLRPFRSDDAPTLRRLVSDWVIARTTLSIPHPYPAGLAETWIATHEGLRAAGREYIFAVVRRADDILVGCVSLRPDAELDTIGYWIGRPYWGCGYATEAARALVRFAFDVVGLEQVTATHLVGNPASGRVMQKIGMRRVGALRKRHLIRDEDCELELYLLRRAEFAGADATSGKAP